MLYSIMCHEAAGHLTLVLVSAGGTREARPARRRLSLPRPRPRRCTHARRHVTRHVTTRDVTSPNDTTAARHDTQFLLTSNYLEVRKLYDKHDTFIDFIYFIV